MAPLGFEGKKKKKEQGVRTLQSVGLLDYNANSALLLDLFRITVLSYMLIKMTKFKS